MNLAIFSRIKNLIILALAGVRFIFNGRADKKVEMPKKILIVYLGKLGDMVCATPLFRAIKIKYPDCRVCIAGNIVNKELLQGNSDVDEYFIYPPNFSEFFKLVKKEKFDFACVAAPDFLTLAILYLAGVPCIAAPVIENGFSPYETRAYKIIRNFVITRPHRMGNYAVREYLRLLEPIGIFSDNTKKYLYFSEAAEKSVKNFLRQNNINPDSDFIVGITPSAGNKIKEWPAIRFAKLADYICEKYRAKVIIIGGKNDELETKEMIGYLAPGTEIIDSTGRFNIEELKALVSKLKLFVSVDTGVIYIAEAFGVPTIDIIGPIDEKEQPPIGKLHKIVVAQRQKPELYVMNARVYDEKEAKRQVDEITVEMVIKELDDLMRNIYPKNNL